MSLGRAQVPPQGYERECVHSGYYSGLGLYSRDSRTLRYVLVCDDCGEEIKELSKLDYSPCPVIAVAAPAG